MDTAGKGGIVRHVVGSVDPRGVEFAAFEKPMKKELAHDFLWCSRPRTPGPGMIGAFDRFHDEDVLIITVMLHISPDEQKDRLMERVDRSGTLGRRPRRRQRVRTPGRELRLHLGEGERRS